MKTIIKELNKRITEEKKHIDFMVERDSPKFKILKSEMFIKGIEYALEVLEEKINENNRN